MIDFNQVSLPTLLKMAYQVRLISYYECDAQHVICITGERRLLMRPQEAKTFICKKLMDWWQQEEKRMQPVAVPDHRLGQAENGGR